MLDSRRRVLAAGLAIAGASGAWAQLATAQTAAGGGNALSQRGWDVRPSIGLDFTQTDNVSLTADNKKSDPRADCRSSQLDTAFPFAQ